jgi:hypothetical protein
MIPIYSYTSLHPNSFTAIRFNDEIPAPINTDELKIELADDLLKGGNQHYIIE